MTEKKYTRKQIEHGLKSSLASNVTAAFKAGEWLTIAKQCIEAGDWGTDTTFEGWLPEFGISRSYAYKFISIHGNTALHVSHERLPRDINVLYELSRIPEDKLTPLIADGTVRVGMSRGEAHDLALRNGGGNPGSSKAKSDTAPQLRAQLDHAVGELDKAAEELTRQRERADAAEAAAQELRNQAVNLPSPESFLKGMEARELARVLLTVRDDIGELISELQRTPVAV